MKLSPVNSFRIKQLLLIVIYWVVMIRFMVAIEFFGVDTSSANKLFVILRQSILAATLAGFVIGLLTGLFEILLFRKHHFKISIIRIILLKLVVYSITIYLITSITAFFYYQFYRDADSLEAAHEVWRLLSTSGFYYIFLVGLLLSTGINFVLLVQNKIGIGSFGPILLGRYHKPKEESRIFLFIDLRSSTRAAEILGHVNYSRMIQLYYRDLSELVIRFKGTIYQFVGDEVVLTWKTKNHKNYVNSISLFYAFKDKLQNKKDKYQQRFDMIPEFKGSINAGNVMVAEVGGNIKSEIAYHGDVLNTAARMLELCKPLQKELIISSQVKDQLGNILNNLEFTALPQNQLRGKEKQQQLYSVDKKQNTFSG